MRDCNKRKLKNSQNFLKSSQLVVQLLANSGICNKDVVFEIGPGKGIITRQLSKIAFKVVAVEYDQKLVAGLQEMFDDYGGVEIIFGDFLQTPLPKRGDYKVFANIPFDLTADVLDKLTLTLNPPQDTYLIVQEEVAKKYAGHPYGEERLCSLILKPRFELSIVHQFHRWDFDPVPSVDINMLRIKKRQQCLLNSKEFGMYQDFIAYAFRQSGANLGERLKRVFTYKQFRRQAFECDFDLCARPGELCFEQWLGLYQYFINHISVDKRTLVCGSYRRLVREQCRLQKIHRTRDT